MSRRSATVLLEKGADELAARGAAYALTGRAYARLAPRAGRLAAILEPKRGSGPRALKALARDFRKEYAVQLEFWRKARLEREERLKALARALSQAEPRPKPALPPASLSAREKARIESLLAEAASSEPDPLGIRRNWSDLRRGKEPAHG